VAGPIEGSTFHVAIVSGFSPVEVAREVNKKIETINNANRGLPGIGIKTTMTVSPMPNPDTVGDLALITVLIEARYIE